MPRSWKHKNKDFIAAEQKAFEDRVAQEVQKRVEDFEASSATEVSESTETPQEVVEVSEASEEVDEVSEALENVQPEGAALINNNESSSSKPDSLRDRFAKTFKESVKISY